MKKEFINNNFIKSKFFGEIECVKFNGSTEFKETIGNLESIEDIIQDNLDELNEIYLTLD